MLVSTFLLAPVAHAGLTVSPIRVVVPAKPKQTASGFFDLENKGQEPIAIEVQAEDWAAGATGGRSQVPWLAVKPDRFTLKPGARMKVKYTIRVPKDATVGELRAQVFFTTSDADAPAGFVGMRSRLGAIIYVPIEGTATLGAEITQIDAAYSASTPGVAQPDRFDVALGILNRSNIHIIPEGDILIRSEAGQVVSRITLPRGWGLLPGEQDTYRAVGSAVHLKPGRYTLSAVITYGQDVGRKATMERATGFEIGKDGTLTLSHPLP